MIHAHPWHHQCCTNDHVVPMLACQMTFCYDKVSVVALESRYDILRLGLIKTSNVDKRVITGPSKASCTSLTLIQVGVCGMIYLTDCMLSRGAACTQPSCSHRSLSFSFSLHVYICASCRAYLSRKKFLHSGPLSKSLTMIWSAMASRRRYSTLLTGLFRQ